MLQAYGRLLLITIISLVVITTALFGIRIWGLQNSYISVDHPLNKAPFFVAAKSGGTEVAPPHSKEAYDYISSLSKDIWLEADLRITKDRQWVLFGGDFLEQVTEGKGRLKDITLSDLRKLNTGHHFPGPNGDFPFRNTPTSVMTIAEFMDRYPEHRLILDLHSKAPGAAEALAELLKARKAGSRVIVFSRIPLNTEIIRSRAPLWLYGEPTTHFAKLNVLAALHIESVATILGDVLFVPMIDGSKTRARKNLVQEFLRRKRLIILDGTSIEEAKKNWIFSKAFGFLTLRPTEAFNSL